MIGYDLGGGLLTRAFPWGTYTTVGTYTEKSLNKVAKWSKSPFRPTTLNCPTSKFRREFELCEVS